ncbi:uncharacterized protein LOC113862037 [Abrus precatorius]|uniref:Uncharacterized protein LOC113862037 n=1 Tax=Abrus precatorius TaxID=3816 RepID=A0A8B8L468_ABRPR|nr:uncharacterized protein LOC113862037 [Abrus precatorius]XP_027350996.1 uncharacterized protein LOC113862037 [Abrus precatorius]XP_027350997.1 uncharacterized protein LOC113862037 [Abrus precatorius]
MARGGKVSGKRSFRKKVRSKEGGSDDSDEDYVVSDDGRDVSDCPEDSFSSLDGCASEESFDDFIEEEDEGEEEIRQVRKFNRSKAKSSDCDQRKIVSKTSRKRGRIAYAEQLEQEEEQGGDGDDDDEEEDEDFNYDDDEEFTPEEEDYSAEEEETMERKKNNDGVKMGKKVLRKRVSATSTTGRKRRISRASRKPKRKRRRRSGGLLRKVQLDDVDDFIDSPAIRIKSRKKLGWERRRIVLEDSNSDSDCVSGSSDYEFTISEEEREQVREAKELCLRRNLRSSSLLVTNEVVGVHDNVHQLRKPPARKGKEKVEESQGRKGKEKIEDLKSEVGKQVCGICLSEENKRRLRGVLNCCTHYFCFACIMEWSKVESRCPLCKQRFKTISKPARSTAGVDLREVVIQVPERDQVYQPSEEELRSYIDPYEYVICSECHQGGDDGLMLLCDICDSPAHTYCVGLGREVPEGNWYCNGCRPVALGSSNSQVQERVTDPRLTTQSLPIRSSSGLNVRESIDLNMVSSPRTSFNQAFVHLPSSRLSGRNVEGASPVPGGGAPTLSERRWIHRQIQQLLSVDRMNSPTATTNGISATSSTNNLYNSQIDQSREPVTQHTRTQDVGTSYHTFFEERLCNNLSPLIQNGDSFSIRISNSRRQVIHNSAAFANGPVNGVLWPGLVAAPPISGYEAVHQFGSRANINIDGSLPPAIKEESNFFIVKEQLQSMVNNHLKSFSRDIDLGRSTFQDIARSSMHTTLAACGLEHDKSEVCTVPPPVCPHIELMAGGQTSLIKGCCSSCFDSFVGDVVKRILDTRMSSQWLRLGL